MIKLRRVQPRAAALLVTLTLAAGLAACTGDEPTPPTESGSVTASPSVTPAMPSETPTATPPVAPTAEATPQSAEAFVKYFWKVNNYAYITLDVDYLKRVSNPGCSFCSNTIKDLANLKRTGARVDGASVQVSAVSAPPGQIKRGVIVAALIRQAPGTITRGGVTETSQGTPQQRAYIGLEWSSNRWFVDDVSIEKVKTS